MTQYEILISLERRLGCQTHREFAERFGLLITTVKRHCRKTNPYPLTIRSLLVKETKGNVEWEFDQTGAIINFKIKGDQNG